MKRLLGKLSFLLIIATAMSMVSSNAAFAEVGQGNGEVQGGGSIFPGLTTTPTPQSFHFTGSVTGDFVVGTNVAAGTINCTFDGSDSGFPLSGGGTVLNGGGPVSGSCDGIALVGGHVTASATGTFIRVGGAVVVLFGGPTGGSATVCINGQCSTGIAAAQLAFVPGQPTPPVTYYTVAGIVGFIGT